AFQKTYTADQCAARLRELIIEREKKQNNESNTAFSTPKFNRDLNTKDAYSFKTRTGRVYIDHTMLSESDAQRIVGSCPVNILTLNAKRMPVLAIDADDAYKGKCIECFACEYASYENGRGGVRLEFPVAGLT
ncbi:MAG TPA: hypothetical protein VNJ29_01980, partial [Candidatus Nitrosotenuis sp.]|nr:hypothetical protein [Candidatus Nitrosotenuis sp.]